MARIKVWTLEKYEAEIAPLLEKGWTIAEIARTKGLSRQRLHKIIQGFKEADKGD